MSSRSSSPSVPRTLRAPASRQRGATLFIALMLLILLTLLALSAAQVTGLQERMAGNYKCDADAFDDAEQLLRDREKGVLELTNIACDDPVATALPTDVLNGTRATAFSTIENICHPSAGTTGIPICMSSGGADVTAEIGGPNCAMFRVTAYDGSDCSRSLVQSIHIP